MRGTVTFRKIVGVYVRITPARAGNSVCQGDISGQCQDHPRACGEQANSLRNGQIRLGSPPRVRGTAGPDRVTVQNIRITPARAGNRKGQQQLAGACWDHPRACGEQPNYGPWYYAKEGSPPRVRGTVCQQAAKETRMGITPARAGNRLIVIEQAGHDEDHPRACGEQ